MSNSKNVLTIAYPESHPGTASTKITFHNETPDLEALFNPGAAEGPRRRFVTHATLATLLVL